MGGMATTRLRAFFLETTVVFRFRPLSSLKLKSNIASRFCPPQAGESGKRDGWSTPVKINRREQVVSNWYWNFKEDRI